MHLLQLLISAMMAGAAQTPFTVILDPGHGGVDNGAVREGHNEADITLKVSQQVFALLKKDKRFRAHLTRETDHTVSLNERAQMAKTKKADLFVSIHVNASPDSRAHGAEFYFQNQLPPDEESMFLAHRENSEDGSTGRPIPYEFLEKNSYPSDVTSIVDDLLDTDRILRSSQLSKALKIEWRGSKKSKSNSVRQAPFYVLSQMSTPSSLIELGFLTNASDLNELTNPAAQKRMAEDIYRGIKAYKESMDKTER